MALTSGSAARSSSCLRKRDLVDARAVRPAAARPRAIQPVEILGDDREVRLGDGVVEPHHDLAGLDQIAIAREQFADDAAGRVLHLLDVGFDHDLARRDQRARDFRGRGPAAEAAGQHQRRWRGRRCRCGADRALRAFRAVVGRCHTASVMIWRLPPSETILIGVGGATRGCSTCASTVSFGPKACMRPSFSTRIWSTPSMPIGPVRDHHDDGAAFARGADRPRQRLVAFGVEIGIRLVEHDQERIAVERARQRHALRLAGRQRGALLADLACRSRRAS